MYKNTEHPIIFVNTSNLKQIECAEDLCKTSGITTLVVTPDDPSIIDTFEENEIHFRIPDQYARQYSHRRDVTFVSSFLPTEEISGYYLVNSDFIDMMQPRDNIMWKIPFSIAEWKKFDDKLRLLMQLYKDKKLLIDDVIIRLSDIRQHPCRIGMCSGDACHSKHSNLPRNIVVKDGILYPMCLPFPNYRIGSIDDAFCFHSYRLSDNHLNYLRINEKLYSMLFGKVKYTYLPWECLLGEIYAQSC